MKEGRESSKKFQIAKCGKVFLLLNIDWTKYLITGTFNGTLVENIGFFSSNLTIKSNFNFTIIMCHNDFIKIHSSVL